MLKVCLAAFLICCFSFSIFAEQKLPLRVAVAANFSKVANVLVEDFNEQTGLKVSVSSGSTGALFAQISHGAPFDLFMAADVSRPLALEQQGLIVADTRQTYAVGQLALWDNQIKGEQAISHNELKNRLSQSGRLSIANPNTAPYGVAAIQVLEALNLSTCLEPSLVKGNSVLHAFQYVETGNVNRGLVAYHLIANKLEATLVPQDLYSPLKQQVVVLKSSKQIANALRFQRFVLSSAVQDMLHEIGYSANEAGVYSSVKAGE